MRHNVGVELLLGARISSCWKRILVSNISGFMILFIPHPQLIVTFLNNAIFQRPRFGYVTNIHQIPLTNSQRLRRNENFVKLFMQRISRGDDLIIFLAFV